MPRVLPDFTFWFVRGGAADLQCAGRSYAMRAGDLLLVPPGVVHTASHDPTQPLWTVTAHFVPVDATGVPWSVPSEDLPPIHRRLLEPQVFDQHFSRLLMLSALRSPAWQVISRSLYLALLAELYREDVQATLTHGYGRQNYPALAETLLQLEAEGRYFVHPGILAEACGFSLGHFSRIFHRQFGCTPQQYLLRRRIDRARHLLLESDLSVQQVAQALGYRDIFFFTRQFKAVAKQPPATFRRAGRA